MDHHQRHPYQQHHHHLHHHVAHRRLPHSHPLHVQAEQTQFTNQHDQIVHLPETKIVYFCVGHKEEVAKFSSDTQAYLIKELFRSAAEAGPSDVLKLYDAEGHLMNISGELSSNSPTSRYNLEVVATHTNGMLLEEVGVDLAALEARVVALEQALCAEQDILPLGVRELKQQVEEFRHKLENTEHLSWLGFHKQLPTPISSEECRRLQYRRKSDTVKKRVKERFMQISDTEVSERIRQWLRMPTFDSRQWEDEEVLLLLQTMFVDLDLCSRFAIDLHTLRTFLYEVYKNYNEVPFHNFRHCFCVAQMMYAITWAVNLPSKIGDLEILILIVSCICHDLDHPGYNNIYQINAKTELALRYNDISPLENHHCSVAFRLLENDDCNIFKSFSNETFKQVREGMIRCILATDMARHNEILAQFKEITPEFDYTNKAHINLLTMVLIKVADISNEARPMDVAEPWLDRLLQEFFKQSDAEKLEGLPVTPFMDREKITKPSSQCSFIGFVLLPLFEALGDLLTELQDLIVQPVRDALDYYRRLNEATKEERLHRKSVVAELLDHPALAHSHPTCPQPPFSNACQNQQSAVSPDINSSEGTSATSVTPPTMVGNVPKSVSNHSVKSKKSISFQQTRSRSRSTDEEFEQSVEILHSDEDQNLADLVEDNESGDSETATEVEVSEKTLKFKISTEGNIASAGRKSYPGSRKGSRDRTQHTTCSELAKALQKEKERGRLGPAAVSFDGRIPGNRMSLDMSDNYDGLKKFHGKSLDGRGRYSGLSTPTSGKSVNFLEDDEFKELHLRPTKENNIRASDEKIAEKSLRTSEKVIFTEKIASPGDDSNLSKIKTDTKLSKEDVSLKCNELKTTDLDEIFVEKISEINRKGMEKVIDTQNGKMSQNNNTRSFLARIKQFTDKFNISLDKDSKGSKLNSDDNVSRNNNGNTTKTFGTKCRKFETNCCRKVSIDDYTEVKKASTLPKIQKKCSESKKLGWKNLISVSNKDIKSNSVEVLPSDKESVEILKPKQSEDRLSLESPCTSYKTQRNAPGVGDFDGTRTPSSPNSAATKHEHANVNQTRNQSGRMDDQSKPEQNPSQGTNISLIQRVRDDDRFRSSKDNI